MFALVLFSDNAYYICKKTNIIKRKNDYSVKYKDGKRYAGKIIAYNENYEELVTVKMEVGNKNNVKNRKQTIYKTNISERRPRKRILLEKKEISYTENKENLFTENADTEIIETKKLKRRQIATRKGNNDKISHVTSSNKLDDSSYVPDKARHVTSSNKSDDSSYVPDLNISKSNNTGKKKNSKFSISDTRRFRVQYLIILIFVIFLDLKLVTDNALCEFYTHGP